MRPFLQALLLIAVATVIAVVANIFAAPTRKLALPAGFYPNALRVPPREPVRVAPPPITETAAMTTTSATDSAATPVLPPPLTVTTATAAATRTSSAPAPPAAAATVAPAPPAAPVAAKPAPAPAAAVDVLNRFRPHPDKAYIEISGDDAAALHARGVLFLDARRTSAYEEGHIAGARPFSVWEADVDDKVNALFSERQDSQDQPIVIYCTGGACEDSHMLSEKLWGIQFNNVYVYKDGFPDWEKRRGAARRGAQP